MKQVRKIDAKAGRFPVKQLFILMVATLMVAQFGCDSSNGGNTDISSNVTPNSSSHQQDGTNNNNNKNSQTNNGNNKNTQPDDSCEKNSYCRNEYCLKQDENYTGKCVENKCECEVKPNLPMGMVGDYVSIHGSDKLKAIAAYNATYGDLMVKTFTGDAPTDTDKWIIVDGFDDNGVEVKDRKGNKDGFRKGIDDPGLDRGKYTSVFVDDETIHIAYQAEDTDGKYYLRYARMTKDGVVEFATLDKTMNSGNWTQIAVIGEDVHIVHSVSGDENELASVRHITFKKNADLNTLTPPTPTEIQQTAVGRPCTAVECTGMTTQCIISTGTCESPSGICPQGCAEGFSCIGGVCEKFYQNPEVMSYPQHPGAYARLLVTKDNTKPLHLTYFDGWTGHPKAFTFDGSAWTEDALTFSNKVSPHTSVAFDKNDKPFYVAMDVVSKNLNYIGDSGNVTIANGTNDNYNDPTGFFNRVYNLDGTLVVAYQYPSEKTFYVQKSTDDGATWSTIADTNTYAPNGELGVRGFYLNGYAAADAVYIAAEHINLKKGISDVEVIKVEK